VDQANSWPRLQGPPGDPCLWLSIDELLRADIMQPSWHLIRTFCPADRLAAGQISLIRSDADMVDRGKEWIRLRYVLTDPRTGHQRQVDRRMMLARSPNGPWRFVIGGQMYQHVCLLHVDDDLNCAQGKRATTDRAQAPTKQIQEPPSADRQRRTRFSIVAKLAEATTAAAEFIVSLSDFRLWTTALSWLARSAAEKFAQLTAARGVPRTYPQKGHSVTARGPPSASAAAAVKSAQPGWSAGARGVSVCPVTVRPVDIRAKPHDPAAPISLSPPRRVAKMDRSHTRSGTEQASRRKVPRERLEPHEDVRDCVRAKTMPNRGKMTTAKRLVGRTRKHRLVLLVHNVAVGFSALCQACRPNAKSLAPLRNIDPSRPTPSTFSASQLRNQFCHGQLRSESEPKGDHAGSNSAQMRRLLTKLARANAPKLFNSRHFKLKRWQAAVLSFARVLSKKVALLIAKAAERWRQARNDQPRRERA
jgi:hypothetical protein